MAPSAVKYTASVHSDHYNVRVQTHITVMMRWVVVRTYLCARRNGLKVSFHDSNVPVQTEQYPAVCPRWAALCPLQATCSQCNQERHQWELAMKCCLQHVVDYLIDIYIIIKCNYI